MKKNLLEIASEIVHAQVSVSSMSADEIQQALMKTFAALQRMQRAEQQGGQLQGPFSIEEPVPEKEIPQTLNPKDSIQNNKIVCLECGSEMRQLTARHLQIHDLSPRDYKKKWGFPIGQPLTAKSLTKARSKAAKKRGLPEKLVQYLQKRREGKSQAAPQEEVKEKNAVKRRRKTGVA